MTALTTNYHANEKPGKQVAYNVGANKRIFQGALVCLDTTTGLTEPATDATGKVFAGVALDPVDNRNGAAGAAGGRVQKTGSYVYTLSGDTPSQATVGQAVYAIDDQTVALTGHSTNHVLVGYVVGLVGSLQVRVRIDRAVC